MLLAAGLYPIAAACSYTVKPCGFKLCVLCFAPLSFSRGAVVARCFPRWWRGLAALAFFISVLPSALGVEPPRLVQKDGRWAFFVEGRPYLILGGQIHNSSSWPSELPQVWASLAALHREHRGSAGVLGADGSQQGHFDFGNVNQLVQGARAHNLHLVLPVVRKHGRTVTCTTFPSGSRPIPSAFRV